MYNKCTYLSFKTTALIRDIYYHNDNSLSKQRCLSKQTPLSSQTSSSDHEHAEVRQVPGHPEHGGLEVFLVASQVDESDNLGGLLTDFGPVQASSVTVRFIHHLGANREEQN